MKTFWTRRPLIPVVVLHGMLATRAGALNLDGFGPVIDRAFAAAGKGGHVILDINSPGGSAVQSDLIASRIRRRAEADGIKVKAVISDVGASGGYWLACAADEILANPMSIVGSIGVLGGGFGFEEAIERLGVRRRLHTAGVNKARLDPFSPERPEDVAFVQGVLADIHVCFKDWVRTRRAGRLSASEDTVFDGSFMLGSRAKEIGLIDRFGDVDMLVRELGGKRARAYSLRPRRRLFSRLPRFMADAMLDAVEERWAPQAKV